MIMQRTLLSLITLYGNLPVIQRTLFNHAVWELTKAPLQIPCRARHWQEGIESFKKLKIENHGQCFHFKKMLVRML